MNALKFAKECHAGQFRKGGEPYIHHPVRVAGYARLYIPDNATLYIPAAYLHDVMEDCGVTHELLTKKFGVLVADVVQELTNQFTKEKAPNYKRRERKLMEHERLAACSNIAQQLKLCDRLDNIMDRLLFTDLEWAARYIRETYDLLEKIGHSNEELTNIIKERINGYTQAHPIGGKDKR